MAVKIPKVMTIAGFDPSAGAGILADIKTFNVNNVYGFAVTTANTVQNEIQFDSVEWIKPELIIDQLKIILESHSINYFKIGLIQNLEVLTKIVDFIKAKNCNAFIIWDPIIKSSTGFKFHSENNPEYFLPLLKKVDLVTPNIPEAKIIFGDNTDLNQIQDYINNHNLNNVLLKGGHSKNSLISDYLISKDLIIEFPGENFNNQKHGTGCVLSAAILANLANGNNLETSCRNGKKYVEKFITSTSTLLGYHK